MMGRGVARLFGWIINRILQDISPWKFLLSVLEEEMRFGAVFMDDLWMS